MFGSGTHPSDLAKQTNLIILNEGMNDIMKIVKSFEEHDLLIKDISITIKNEAKWQKGGFLGILLGTLGASLLWNLLTGKGAIRAAEETIRASENPNRAGQDFNTVSSFN